MFWERNSCGKVSASELLKFKKKNNKIQKRFVDGILEDVNRITTVHGKQITYGLKPDNNRLSLLALGLIVAIYILALITWNILYIYHYQPMKTVIAELDAPIYKLAFPEIMICNQNRFNWQRYTEAREKFLPPDNDSSKYDEVFRDAIEAFDTLYFGRFHVFENISKLYKPELLYDLNYINFTKVSEFMAWRCDEMFSDCVWQNRTTDCCELFTPRKSPKGQCLSFNTVESEVGARRRKTDRYYPIRTIGRGVKNGLRLRVHIRNGWHSPESLGKGKGVLVMVVEQDVWAYWHRAIPTNSRVFLSIAPRLRIFNENTRQYSSSFRNCMFEDELNTVDFRSLEGHPYMFENCYSECQQEYLMEFCNCSMDMFFPPTQRFPPCRLSDFPCIYRHEEKLRYFQRLREQNYVKDSHSGMICDCYFNCKSLNYRTDYRVEHIPEIFIDPNDTGLEMYIYFLWDSFTIYETSAVYTVFDLMASVGGLAGLCFGCSLVGVTELLFFFFIDLPKRGLMCLFSLQCFKPKKRVPRVRKLFVKRKALPFN
uniref:Pickpocket protein 19-like n=1 Tax=Stomoxys calcitrans TaxID=35570 RepID=A0A1I8PAQ6_STOCA|nr:unnamed protein product [Stomoxys calcitrans]